MTARERTAAVVVLFEPGAEVLDNIETYAGQVARVFAVDNTPRPDPGLQAWMRDAGVTVLPMAGNRGIAAALNAGCDSAIDAGFDWALTLDQDSEAAPGLVDALWECAGDEGLALVAPVIRIEGGVDEPLSAACVDVDFAITSGCLLRLRDYRSLGRFREDLFMDHVDTEFCFRARHEGRRIAQRRDAVLLHRIGRLEERRFPVRHFVTNHSPVRRYYMARNALEVARLYGTENRGWVADQKRQWLRAVPKILLSEDDKLSKLRHIGQGVRDYRARRFGTYEELHPAETRRRG